MKKLYISPSIEIVTTEAIMGIPPTSIGMEGGVDNEHFDYGDEGSSEHDPDAKATSIWDDWSAEGEEEE